MADLRPIIDGINEQCGKAICWQIAVSFYARTVMHGQMIAVFMPL